MAASPITDLQALPAVLTMGDIQRILGVAKKTAAALARRDGFPAVRIGRLIRVPRDAFLRWLEAQAGGQGGPQATGAEKSAAKKMGRKKNGVREKWRVRKVGGRV